MNKEQTPSKPHPLDMDTDPGQQGELMPPADTRSSRISIRSLMLITTVCCLMAASGSQLLKAIQSDNIPRSKFVMFTLTAPVIALVVISVARAILRALPFRSR